MWLLCTIHSFCSRTFLCSLDGTRRRSFIRAVHTLWGRLRGSMMQLSTPSIASKNRPGYSICSRKILFFLDTQSLIACRLWSGVLKNRKSKFSGEIFFDVNCLLDVNKCSGTFHKRLNFYHINCHRSQMYLSQLSERHVTLNKVKVIVLIFSEKNHFK